VIVVDRKEYRLRNECLRLRNLLDYKKEQYSLLKVKNQSKGGVTNGFAFKKLETNKKSSR
jgi:hypothetical protein